MLFWNFTDLLSLSSLLLQSETGPISLLGLDDFVTCRLLAIRLYQRLYNGSNWNIRILTSQMELVDHHFVEVCVNLGLQEHQELLGLQKLSHVILCQLKEVTWKLEDFGHLLYVFEVLCYLAVGQRYR